MKPDSSICGYTADTTGSDVIKQGIAIMFVITSG
jgi:hypothetical protein